MNIPDSIYAGDSPSWTDDVPNYSASDGWTLTYYFTGPKSFSKAAVASGTQFITTLTTSDTDIPPDTYKILGRVSRSGEVHTVIDTFILFLANPAKAPQSQDVRSHVRKVFDSLKVMIETRSTKGFEEMSISTPNGVQRHIKALSWRELKEAYHHYEKLVADELAEGRINEGRGAPRILAKFSGITG